jgi:hypothetical protein
LQWLQAEEQKEMQKIKGEVGEKEKGEKIVEIER